jgi:signal transduction histidine kinase/ligand-binding sensor protein
MTYKLSELIDIPMLQDLQEKLNVIYSFPSAIIDNEGNILTAVAWQDICTKFHRTNPQCEIECIKSDRYILDHIHEANPAVSYQCPHGLVDNATPIIINGHHLGNFFTGQFFHEEPDLEFFKRQAKKYGFDEKSYLEAVVKVPVWTKEKLVQYLDFIKGFIEIIAGTGFRHLIETEASEARKENEDRIREKDIQFRKLSANVSDLIYQFTRRLDGTYFVPIASEGIRNIFGCTPEDVLDDFTPIGRVIHPEDATRVISDIEYSAEHLTYFTCEFRVQIPGKETQWIYSRSTPEKLPDGSVTWYGFNVNITERKLAEQALSAAKEKAEESDRLKSAFLANMSHEIRTPMNGILGFADLLKEPNLSGAEQQEYINIIEKSGARMLNIINEIVDISKIEAGLMNVEMKVSNINERIDFIHTFFKPETEAKGLNFSIKNRVRSDEAMVQTDHEKVTAILTNLVKNAIKYTDKGSIEIGCDLVEKIHEFSLQFYVRDTGIGIPKNRQEAIFDRFIQADIEDRKAFQGAGLGLTISKSYVEMLGGRIWIDSNSGNESEANGSTFYFTIPYICPSVPERKPEITPLSPAVQSEFLDLRILIVDDDDLSVILLRVCC